MVYYWTDTESSSSASRCTVETINIDTPTIYIFFCLFSDVCYAEISTECHHIALWVLCRTQLWGQSGEKGMPRVMLPFISPFLLNIVLFLLLRKQLFSLCLTFVVHSCPLNSRAVIRYTTFISNNLIRWVPLVVFICCPCGAVNGSTETFNSYWLRLNLIFAFPRCALRFPRAPQRSWSLWQLCTTSLKTNKYCYSHTFAWLMAFLTTRGDCRLCKPDCMLSPYSVSWPLWYWPK